MKKVGYMWTLYLLQMSKSWQRTTVEHVHICFLLEWWLPESSRCSQSNVFSNLRMCSWSCWLPLLRSLPSSSASSERVWTRRTKARRGEARRSRSAFAPLPVVPDGCRAVRLHNHNMHKPHANTQILLYWEWLPTLWMSEKQWCVV